MSLYLNHSYLFKPGLWDVSGLFYDSNNKPYPQKGQLLVSHKDDLWIIEGQIAVITEEVQNISSRYEVQAFKPGATYSEWKSETGGPEPVFGLYVIVGDTIMSPWQSGSGIYWGQEVLIYQSETEYAGRGFAFLDKKQVSSWTTQLVYNG